MRDKQHYLELLERNPNALFNISLAASAILAARHGESEQEDRGEEWEAIYRELAWYYGETMTPDEVRAEMDGPQDLITQATAAQKYGLTTQAVRNAITARRLRGYKNLAAHPERQGAILVSQSQVDELWRKEK